MQRSKRLEAEPGRERSWISFTAPAFSGQQPGFRYDFGAGGGPAGRPVNKGHCRTGRFVSEPIGWLPFFGPSGSLFLRFFILASTNCQTLFASALRLALSRIVIQIGSVCPSHTQCTAKSGLLHAPGGTQLLRVGRSKRQPGIDHCNQRLSLNSRLPEKLGIECGRREHMFRIDCALRSHKSGRAAARD
jgi:hypothetical protein